MGRRAQHRTAVQAPRRLTRQGLRTLAARLPVEIVRMIVVAAAQNHIAHSPTWVAQSLALVCRDFQAAVEPVLVETVRVTTRNYSAILAQMDRFAQTKHTIFNMAPYHREYHLIAFKTLSSFAGAAWDLLRFAKLRDFRPRVVTLHDMIEFSRVLTALELLATVTHVHIQNYWISESLIAVLPSTTTHVVVNPSTHHSMALPNISAITSCLISLPSLQRLLVRTMHLLPVEEEPFVRALHRYAQSEREPRLWLDDCTSYGHNRSGAQAQLWDEEANGHDTIWFTGRQLYDGPEVVRSTS